MPQRSRGMLRTSARPIGGRLKLQESPRTHERQQKRGPRRLLVGSRMVPLSVTRRCINLARSPPSSTPCRFSGVAIYQSGRPTATERAARPASVTFLFLVEFKENQHSRFGAKEGEEREHWSARVEGLSLVYLANVWREKRERSSFSFLPLTSPSSSSSYKAPDGHNETEGGDRTRRRLGKKER